MTSRLPLLDLACALRRCRTRRRPGPRDWDRVWRAVHAIAGLTPDQLVVHSTFNGAGSAIERDPLAWLQAALDACGAAGITIHQVAACRFRGARLDVLIGRD